VHEIALAEAIWREVASEMARQDGRLSAIRVVVGAFSGADPESLEFALRLGAADSSWPDVAIDIRREPLAVRCKGCGGEFEPEGFTFRCPACGSSDVQICRGNDLVIESLEVTDDHGEEEDSS
jgi:hydrogenase nickel incorporation protein HypA/HybF